MQRFLLPITFYDVLMTLLDPPLVKFQRSSRRGGHRAHERHVSPDVAVLRARLC